MTVGAYTARTMYMTLEVRDELQRVVKQVQTIVLSEHYENADLNMQETLVREHASLCFRTLRYMDQQRD